MKDKPCSCEEAIEIFKDIKSFGENKEENKPEEIKIKPIKKKMFRKVFKNERN